MLVGLQAAQPSIHFLLRKISGVALARGTWLRVYNQGIEREEKAQHPAIIEPTTSRALLYRNSVTQHYLLTGFMFKVAWFESDWDSKPSPGQDTVKMLHRYNMFGSYKRPIKIALFSPGSTWWRWCSWRARGGRPRGWREPCTRPWRHWGLGGWRVPENRTFGLGRRTEDCQVVTAG